MDNEKIIKLIDSNANNTLRIWDFHSCLLLNKIDIDNYCLCLWNNDYLFVGGYSHQISLIRLNDGKIIKSIDGHKWIIDIKKIFIPKYGECLISQGFYNEQIKLWGNKNN